MNPRPETTNILVMIDEELKQTLDKACAEAGLSRAHWIRIAVAEKLERNGIHVPTELIHPPPRTGKGGKGGSPSHKAQPAKIIHRGAAKRNPEWPDDADAEWPDLKKPPAKADGAPALSKPKDPRRKTA